jgi:hypothetical protein
MVKIFLCEANLGSSIAKSFGLETGFKENQDFIYKSQNNKSFVTQIYSPRKSLLKTQESFAIDPLGTSIDIGFKTITLLPGLGSFALTKVISKSKLLQGGVRGLDTIVGLVSGLVSCGLDTVLIIGLDTVSLKALGKFTECFLLFPPFSILDKSAAITAL